MAIKYKRDDGTEIEIPEDRIAKVWTEDGEEVEGHGPAAGCLLGVAGERSRARRDVGGALADGQSGIVA